MRVKSLVLRMVKDVRPSSGCTEIASVALSVAAAKEGVQELENIRVKIFIDYDTFKNAARVGVPGGGHGIRDCVKRALYADPSKGLEVLGSSTKIYQGKLALEVEPLELPFLFVYTVINGEHASLIAGRHDRILYAGKPLELDEAVERAKLATQRGADIYSEIFDKERKEVKVPYEEFLEGVVSVVEEARVRSKVGKGIELNSSLAEENLNSRKYLGIARSLPARDLKERMAKYVAAAIESRMCGSSIPAMAVAGSGNQGITTTLPFVVYSRESEISESDVHASILVAWLTTSYATAFTKQVSAVCGLGIKAGAGLAAGLGYLLGEGDYRVVEGSVLNHLSTITGMVCDGAKASCCLKGALAVDLAYRSSLLAAKGKRIENEGIVGKSVEETLQNISGYVKKAKALNGLIVDLMKRRV